MYKIRAQDDKTFGPYTADVVRQWITAGRAGPETTVCRVGESTWKAITEFPEFQLALGQPPQASVQALGEGRAAAPTITPRTSGLAIASLLLGSVGFLGITALAGLIMGLVAMKLIARSGGRLQGTGWALVGTVLSGSMLLLAIPALAGLVVIPILKSRQDQAEARCLDNFHELTQAIQAYAASHDGILPSPQSWGDHLVQANLLASTDPAFRCPTRPASLCSYAFNENLSGLNITNVPHNTVLLFESDRGWNACGGPEAASSSRHGMYHLVGFANGTVERVPAWQWPQLRWLANSSP